MSGTVGNGLGKKIRKMADDIEDVIITDDITLIQAFKVKVLSEHLKLAYMMSTIINQQASLYLAVSDNFVMPSLYELNSLMSKTNETIVQHKLAQITNKFRHAPEKINDWIKNSTHSFMRDIQKRITEIDEETERLTLTKFDPPKLINVDYGCTLG